MVIVVCYLVSVLCVFCLRFQQRNSIVFRHTNIGHVIGEQCGYATEIMNGRYIRQTPDNTRRSLFLGGFRTYPS
jgi:hypothetical protein